MKAFVVGATGVLGRETVHELQARGHQVTALARTPKAEAALTAAGVAALPGDIYDQAALERGAAGCDAVLHLATRIPAKPIPSAKDLEETNRLRVEGTPLLVEAARRAGARALLYQSISFIFPDTDGAEVTEDSPTLHTPVVDATLAGERATVDSGLRGVALRGGQFTQRGSYHTNWMEQALRRRRLPLIGRGDGILGLVHPRDLARAFVLAAENETARGVYHVAAEPVEARVFYGEWARRIGAPTPRRIPTWLARWFMGPAVALVASRYRVSSEKIRRELGFTFEFPTYLEILDDATRT